MCGIAGLVDLARRSDAEQIRKTITRMIEPLAHRGPDDDDVWVDVERGLGLGHRRLSIVDLSREGRQPMHSASERYVITYNGEIYNFLELRHDLGRLGHRFRGRSDTEVMLAAIAEWDLEGALGRFNGMFAFALWDRETRALHLVRDRAGEKPLYYTCIGRTFVFGSEVKALQAHPEFSAEIDRDALALFLRHGYVPSPLSIYRGVFKLPPATVLSVHIDVAAGLPAPVPYWSAAEVAARGVHDPFAGSADDARVALDALLRDAVRRRMVADVPLGVFLSGGVDSSTIVALMQAQSRTPVRTFSIGFHEGDYDEADHARAVARHLGTEHTELYLAPKEALAVIPLLSDIYDEPFADSSQIPTFLVSRLARQRVTVSLSGDAGDELFGGYTRYLMCENLWRRVGWLRRPARERLATGLRAVNAARWSRAIGAVNPVLPRRFRTTLPGDKLHKLAEILGAASADDMYEELISHWKRVDHVVVGAQEPERRFAAATQAMALRGLTDRMMYWDFVTYLADDILVKLDRASMAVSLEARVPFLDHHVIEFAWRLPPEMKLRDGRGKWLLRQVLYRYVPHKLIERPKSGFGIPIANWLRGPLRHWAEDLLAEERLTAQGFFHPEPIRTKWAEHLAGGRDWHYSLWNVLMFQAWLARWR
jgi:asparagine synthase (glutamine-hydrolysing)